MCCGCDVVVLGRVVVPELKKSLFPLGSGV